MKFLVDESVEYPVVTFLRSSGHDVVAVVGNFIVVSTDAVGVRRTRIVS